MNGLDITMIIVVIIFGVLGLARGLIRNVFSAAGLFFGFILSGRFYGNVANIIKIVILNQVASEKIAFLLVFLVFACVFVWLGIFFQKLAKFALLGWIDRLGGLILGLISGVSIIGVIMIFLSKYSVPGTGSLLEKSILAPVFIKLFLALGNLLPMEVQDFLKKYLPLT